MRRRVRLVRIGAPENRGRVGEWPTLDGVGYSPHEVGSFWSFFAFRIDKRMHTGLE